jgi:excisionase family DNA binding protein
MFSDPSVANAFGALAGGSLMDKPSCTLTVAEVADLVGVHRITLYAAIKDGTFELVPIRVGRKILFPRSRV